MADYSFAVSPWDFLGPNWQRMPAGMRNNNPGNIKYVGQRDALGPSANTDQGDPQAVYASPQAGINAMHNLLGRKYAGGKHTANQMIAEKGGWTPGNYQAAANVARYAGYGPNDDINFSDPASANRFMAALMMQEHGPASKAYASLLNGGTIPAAPPPNPYAGLPDGPKGQEAYAAPAPSAPAPQQVAQAQPHPGLLSHLTGGKVEMPQGLMQIMNGGASGGNAASSGGGGLLGALAAMQPSEAPQIQPMQAPQGPTLSDYLLQFMQSRMA